MANTLAKTIYPAICISFDDAFASDRLVAYEKMFVERGIKGTSNISTAKIGTDGYLTWAQIQEMYANGWDFQGHGHTHTSFTSLTDEQIETELQAIDDACVAHGIPIPIACSFPSSVYNEGIRTVVKNHGLLAINLTNMQGVELNRHNLDFREGWLHRTGWTGILDLNTDIGFVNFKKIVGKAVNRREMPFFVFHKIVDGADGSDPMETNTDQFAALLDYGIDQGAQFLTFTEAYNYLKAYREY